MSLVLPFLLGLFVGLSICFWKQYQVNRQTIEILRSLSQFEQVKSLSKISLVRRNVNLLNRKYEEIQQELDANLYLLENAPFGYLRIDGENQLIDCNCKAREILGVKRWQPQSFRFFLELVRSYELDQLIQQTRATQNLLVLEWQFFPPATDSLNNDEHLQLGNKTSESILLKAYSCPLPRNHVGVFIENRQAIFELSQSRDRAYADLSHELRTPLTSLSLLAEALLKRTDAQARQWVQQMDREIKRLIDLVQGWLDLSQIAQDPNLNLEYQVLNLKQLVVSAWESLEPLARQKQIALEFFGEETIELEGDLTRLTQVFVNLLDNSIKHTNSGGKIAVEVHELQSQQGDRETDVSEIAIDIIDSGSGFDDEDLPHIFERLYRGDKSRVRKERQGSGLGLAIVKEIVEAHRGRISAQNHPETKGAWLKIQLPQHQVRSNNQ